MDGRAGHHHGNDPDQLNVLRSADPFDDTPDLVVMRLMEIADKAKNRWSAFDPTDVPEFVATGTCTRDLRIALEIGGLSASEAKCAAPWLTDFEVDYLVDVLQDRTPASFELIVAAATVGAECLTPDRIANLSRLFL